MYYCNLEPVSLYSQTFIGKSLSVEENAGFRTSKPLKTPTKVWARRRIVSSHLLPAMKSYLAQTSCVLARSVVARTGHTYVRFADAQKSGKVLRVRSYKPDRVDRFLHMIHLTKNNSDDVAFF